jgi:hypothetical protein
MPVSVGVKRTFFTDTRDETSSILNGTDNDENKQQNENNMLVEQ